jgi:hypothetical protein
MTKAREDMDSKQGIMLLDGAMVIAAEALAGINPAALAREHLGKLDAAPND